MQLRPATALAELVEGGVGGDAIAPGGERGSSVEAVDRPHDPDQRLLGGVVGIAGSAGDAPAHGVDPVVVAAQQRHRAHRGRRAGPQRRGRSSEASVEITAGRRSRRAARGTGCSRCRPRRGRAPSARRARTSLVCRRATSIAPGCSENWVSPTCCQASRSVGGGGLGAGATRRSGTGPLSESTLDRAGRRVRRG